MPWNQGDYGSVGAGMGTTINPATGEVMQGTGPIPGQFGYGGGGGALGGGGGTFGGGHGTQQGGSQGDTWGDANDNALSRSFAAMMSQRPSPYQPSTQFSQANGWQGSPSGGQSPRPWDFAQGGRLR